MEVIKTMRIVIFPLVCILLIFAGLNLFAQENRVSGETQEQGKKAEKGAPAILQSGFSQYVVTVKEDGKETRLTLLPGRSIGEYYIKEKDTYGRLVTPRFFSRHYFLISKVGVTFPPSTTFPNYHCNT